MYRLMKTTKADCAALTALFMEANKFLSETDAKDEDLLHRDHYWGNGWCTLRLMGMW
jgi:hypothetical protein